MLGDGAEPRTGKVTELKGRLNIEGNVKDTKKKIHWAQSSNLRKGQGSLSVGLGVSILQFGTRMNHFEIRNNVRMVQLCCVA